MPVRWPRSPLFCRWAKGPRAVTGPVDAGVAPPGPAPPRKFEQSRSEEEAFAVAGSAHAALRDARASTQAACTRKCARHQGRHAADSGGRDTCALEFGARKRHVHNQVWGPLPAFVPWSKEA